MSTPSPHRDAVKKPSGGSLTRSNEDLAPRVRPKRKASSEAKEMAVLVAKRHGMLRHLREVHELPAEDVAADYYSLTLAEIQAKHNALPKPHTALHTGEPA